MADPQPTIAVPRGALLGETLDLLDALGIDTAEIRSNDRKLVFPDAGVITMRPSDVPSYVEHGSADVGITGKDVLREQTERDVYELLDLGFGGCRMIVAAQAGGDAIAVSARIENDIAELDPADRAGFLRDLGLEEPGLHRVARSAYRLLRLITFFTAGDTEVRAWNLREGETALDAAASIHTDLARGFIRAEVADAEELLAAGSYAVLRERGKQRLEGRDYVMRDGDVVTVKFTP